MMETIFGVGFGVLCVVGGFGLFAYLSINDLFVVWMWQLLLGIVKNIMVFCFDMYNDFGGINLFGMIELLVLDVGYIVLDVNIFFFGYQGLVLVVDGVGVIMNVLCEVVIFLFYFLQLL